MQDDMVPEENESLTLDLKDSREYESGCVAQLCLRCGDFLGVDVSSLDHAEEQFCDTRGIATLKRYAINHCKFLPVGGSDGDSHAQVLEDGSALLVVRGSVHGEDGILSPSRFLITQGQGKATQEHHHHVCIRIALGQCNPNFSF